VGGRGLFSESRRRLFAESRFDIDWLSGVAWLAK